MRLEIRKKSEVWRGRGRPRRTIPDEVRKLADQTYKTGNVGTVDYQPDDEDDIIELARLLRSYAKSRDLHMSIQRDPTQLRFEMVDKPRRTP